MSGKGHVISVDPSSSREGKSVWQIVTDYIPPPEPDGLKPCDIWIPRPGSCPDVGEMIEWGDHHAWWGTDANGGGPTVKVDKIDWDFDLDDPALWTG